MTATLTGLIALVEDFLKDGANVKYSEAEITRALQVALSEASLAAGQSLVISGLDGAELTTLPPRLEQPLACGAAGICAMMRAGARAEWERRPGQEPERLMAWGEYWFAHFQARLAEFYPAATARTADQRRTASPWAAWNDDFGERDGG